MDKQPESMLEAVRFFADEERARDFFVHLRWPNGVGCTHCGSMDVQYTKTRKQWQCKDCKGWFSAKTGTIFEDSPLGFNKWMPCVWLIANAKNGISSCEVGRAVGVTQKTAWFMLHRIRLAMDETPTGQRLSGAVEADETYVGGKKGGGPPFAPNRRRRGGKGPSDPHSSIRAKIGLCQTRRGRARIGTRH